MAQWIKTSVRFDKTMENGAIKKVTEPYLVDAISFTEAEARIIEEVAPYIIGDFTVSAVKKSNISEIFWDESGDRWYQVKAAFSTLDEKTGIEKRSITVFMVQASDFKNAYNNFTQSMKGTMVDFEIVSITETPIIDVYKAKQTTE